LARLNKSIFVRHGEAESYRDKTKPGLSEIGKIQIRNAIPKIAGHYPTRIVSSPTPRALESAEIIADALGIPLEIENGLAAINTSEIDVGAFLAAVKASKQPWQTRWKNPGWPGLETHGTYIGRVTPAIKAIIMKYDRAVIVGHSEMYQIIAAEYGISVAFDADVENACVIAFESSP
jgi:broad specificity phosphatase PhoE